jgi:hypothetical protein
VNGTKRAITEMQHISIRARMINIKIPLLLRSGSVCRQEA